MITRIDDSRNRMRQMLDASWGVYIKQEPKQRDSWRDVTYGQLWSHLLHEVEEIKKSTTKEKRLHNALDLCGLAALLAAKVQLEVEEGLNKK